MELIDRCYEDYFLQDRKNTRSRLSRKVNNSPRFYGSKVTNEIENDLRIREVTINN